MGICGKLTILVPIIKTKTFSCEITAQEVSRLLGIGLVNRIYGMLGTRIYC